jgi:predicted amidohydrolase
VKIAVVQHRLRGIAGEDASALLGAAEIAADAGADFVIYPEVPTLHGDDNPDRVMLFIQLGGVAGQRLIPQVPESETGFAGLAAAPEGLDDLGTMAMLVGDACVEPAEIQRLADACPDIAILIPRAESELQAEAFLEYAIALSDSLAGLVIVAEATGGGFGEPGHGGSAIISCGKVLAEAVGDEDVLVAEVTVPPVQPEPREPLPPLPLILEQRRAAHRGEHVETTYLADLTGGAAER